MTNTINKAALLAAMETEGVDMNKAQTGGGGAYKPPAAGPVQLRLFAYIELGKHESTFQGETKKVDKCLVGFELSGPNHPPREDGTPMTMFLEMTKFLNEKARFFKLFTRLNHAGKAKHIVGLLGEAYLGTIYHRAYTRKDGTPGISADLNAKGEPYDIRPTSFIHPGSGLPETVQVAALRTPEMVFLFDRPDLDQWASIHIAGEYPARTDDAGKVTAPARSKNVHQARIMKALNFKGSAVETMLVTNDKPLDIPDAETPDEGQDADEAQAAPAKTSTPTGAAAADLLNGVV